MELDYSDKEYSHIENEIEKMNHAFEIQNNDYCLGSYIKTNDFYFNNPRYGTIFLIGTRIPPTLFFEILSPEKIESFMEEYAYCAEEIPKIEILQTKMLTMKFDSYAWVHYTVVIKTFWLKIIQRTWKKIFAKKMAHYKSPKHFINMQMTGYWNAPIGLRGMLNIYRKN